MPDTTDTSVNSWSVSWHRPAGHLKSPEEPSLGILQTTNLTRHQTRWCARCIHMQIGDGGANGDGTSIGCRRTSAAAQAQDWAAQSACRYMVICMARTPAYAPVGQTSCSCTRAGQVGGGPVVLADATGCDSLEPLPGCAPVFAFLLFFFWTHVCLAWRMDWQVDNVRLALVSAEARALGGGWEYDRRCFCQGWDSVLMVQSAILAEAGFGNGSVVV